jgi:hypothetical protein
MFPLAFIYIRLRSYKELSKNLPNAFVRAPGFALPPALLATRQTPIRKPLLAHIAILIPRV